MIGAVIVGFIGGAIAGTIILRGMFGQEDGTLVGIVFGIIVSVGKYLGSK